MPDRGYRGYHGDGQLGPNGEILRTKTGWSVAGILTAANANKSVSLQEVFPEAGIYTVQFFITSLDAFPPASTDPIRATALLEWTIAGNTIRRKIHVSDGTSISGMGEGVRVVMQDASDTSLVGLRYNATFVVSKGARPTTPNPPFLEIGNGDPITIAGGAQSAVAIPDDCGASSVLVMIAAPGGVAVPDQGVIVSQIAGTFLYRQYDPRSILWAPLSAGVNEINVLNNTAADIRASILIGIDG